MFGLEYMNNNRNKTQINKANKNITKKKRKKKQVAKRYGYVQSFDIYL